jgi:RNase P/RNase MRP subunit POP5
MKIKPSKRAKKRYIVFEVISNELDDDSAIHNAIKKSAFNVLGARYREAGIRFLKNKYRPRIHRGIFRVNNAFARSVVTALNKTKGIKTLGMSGVLKKAEDKYLKIAS